MSHQLRALTVTLLALALPRQAVCQGDPLKGLPVHPYVPAQEPVGGVVFFSGDGGWRSFDKTNADSLQALGYWVLGVDDLRLFASEMPGDTLAVVGRRLVGYLRGRLPAGAPVYLAGYSFGASIVADAAARGVTSDGLYLLGPGVRGIRKITLEGFMERDPTGQTSFDVAERLNARGCIPVAFITGDKDKAGKGAVVFPLVRQPVQQFLVTGASHHYYGGDARYMTVARQALEWLKRHRGECAP
jgi:type IV secretory pathway VirJ component